MVESDGIEPTYFGLRPNALPIVLTLQNIVSADRIRLHTCKMAVRENFEISTLRLTTERSASELPDNKMVGDKGIEPLPIRCKPIILPLK